MSTVIEVRGVSKHFKRLPVLTDVNLDVEAGSCSAIQGPNGSGKSVLFKIICGFVRPDTGHVRIDPAYMSSGQSFPQAFGVVIDRPGYLANMTGRENLQALAGIRNLIGADEIDNALLRVGLDPDLGQRVGHYSLGMKQKLALAQAFMEHQQVLLLDEPFNALDESSVTLVRELLAEFLAEGRTILFTSHNQTDVDVLATSRFRIDGGRLIVQT